MKIFEDAWPKIDVGTRVRVLTPDMEQVVGLGTYLGWVPSEELRREFDSMKDDEAVSEKKQEAILAFDELFEVMEAINAQIPKIILDSGETIYGIECWFEPIPENKSVN